MRPSVGQFNGQERDASWKSRKLAACTIATNESPPNQGVSIASARNTRELIPVRFAAFWAIIGTFCTNPAKPESNKLTSHLIPSADVVFSRDKVFSPWFRGTQKSTGNPRDGLQWTVSFLIEFIS
jgi:hypothetical protein